ncbi:HEAT repeat domain-containing protein [Enhygromyxa salina]|nr:HEAT repeat domain-containing protein [Enhygromyxa salina]
MREHLDEAEFLVETWSNCVDSPKFSVAKLRAGPEQRLLAHLEALRVGGPIVVERLLLPALNEVDDDEFRTAAVGLAILHGAGLDACEQLLASLDRAEEVGHRGLVRGLSLSQRDGLVPWLGRDLDRLAPRVLASRLQILAAHRVNAGQRLVAWLGAEDLEVRRAAAQLARHTGAPSALHLLHPLMQHEDDALRWAAIESGLIRGQMPAWLAVAREAFSPRGGTRQREALGWLAMLGDASVHQRLLTTLRDAPTRALVWAAGLTGRPAAIDLALELLEDPRLARLAGEVVCAIAGLRDDEPDHWLDRGVRVGDADDDGLPPLDRDDLERGVIPSGDDKLRLPDPDAVRFWWARRRSQLDPRLRYSNGAALDLPALARSLAAVPTRRRHPLALELAARTTGRAQIATWALTGAQHGQIQDVFARLAFADFQRGLALPGN